MSQNNLPELDKNDQKEVFVEERKSLVSKKKNAVNVISKAINKTECVTGTDENKTLSKELLNKTNKTNNNSVYRSRIRDEVRLGNLIYSDPIQASKCKRRFSRPVSAEFSVPTSGLATNNSNLPAASLKKVKATPAVYVPRDRNSTSTTNPHQTSTKPLSSSPPIPPRRLTNIEPILKNAIKNLKPINSTLSINSHRQLSLDPTNPLSFSPSMRARRAKLELKSSELNRSTTTKKIEFSDAPSRFSFQPKKSEFKPVKFKSPPRLSPIFSEGSQNVINPSPPNQSEQNKHDKLTNPANQFRYPKFSKYLINPNQPKDNYNQNSAAYLKAKDSWCSLSPNPPFTTGQFQSSHSVSRKDIKNIRDSSKPSQLHQSTTPPTSPEDTLYASPRSVPKPTEPIKIPQFAGYSKLNMSVTPPTPPTLRRNYAATRSNGSFSSKLSESTRLPYPPKSQELSNSSLTPPPVPTRRESKGAVYKFPLVTSVVPAEKMSLIHENIQLAQKNRQNRNYKNEKISEVSKYDNLPLKPEHSSLDDPKYENLPIKQESPNVPVPLRPSQLSVSIPPPIPKRSPINSTSNMQPQNLIIAPPSPLIPPPPPLNTPTGIPPPPAAFNLLAPSTSRRNVPNRRICALPSPPKLKKKPTVTFDQIKSSRSQKKMIPPTPPIFTSKMTFSSSDLKKLLSVVPKPDASAKRVS